MVFLCTIIIGPAQGSHQPCHIDHDTVVVFGNGILTEDTGSYAARDIVKESLRARLDPLVFDRLEFGTARNRSGNALTDLYESLEQRLPSDNIAVSFWRWLGGREEVPEAVREELLAMVNRFDVSEMIGTEDLAEHLNIYRSSIEAGKKVVVVDHSQGNFFGNSARSVIASDLEPTGIESFGLVCVANPASFCAGDGPHTTLVEDLVIAGIALSSVPTGTLLPQFANITNIGSGAEGDHWSGHFFNENYMLDGSRTVEKIIEDIVTVRNGLAQPPQEDCVVPEPPQPEPPITPHCSDGIDNEGDGKTDWDGGSDNNGDGLPDGIPDPGCTGPTDTNEFNIISIRGG